MPPAVRRVGLAAGRDGTALAQGRLVTAEIMDKVAETLFTFVLDKHICV